MKTLTLLIKMLLVVSFMVTPLAAQQTEEHRINLLDCEIFEVDDSHSILKFSIKFMGFVNVEGSFDDFNAAIFYNESDLSTLSVIVRINAASINTGSDFRDKDLRSERFFDVENYPEIVFKSTSIELSNESDGSYLLHGLLTLKGVEKQIVFPIDHVLKRTMDSIWGNMRIGFTGETTLNRYDYNVTGGDNWGTEMLSDEVQISFSILGRIFNMNKIAYRNREKNSIGELLEQKIKSGGIGNAISFYRTVNESKPDSINISARELYVLTHRLKQNNEIENAIKICKLYVESYPDSPDANATMAELMAIRGNREEAIKYYTKVLYLEPEDKGIADIANLAIGRLKRN